jgi:hypothetical protein
MNILTTPLGLLSAILLTVITLTSYNNDCAIDKKSLPKEESFKQTSIFVNSILDTIKEQGNATLFAKDINLFIPSKKNIAIINDSGEKSIFRKKDTQFATCGSQVDIAVVIKEHGSNSILLSKNFNTTLGQNQIPTELEVAALGMRQGELKTILSDLSSFPVKELNIKNYGGKRIYEINLVTSNINNGIEFKNDTFINKKISPKKDTPECLTALSVRYRIFKNNSADSLSEFQVNSTVNNLSKFVFNQPLLGLSQDGGYIIVMQKNDLMDYVSNGIKFINQPDFQSFEELNVKLNKVNNDELLFMEVDILNVK